LATTNPVWFFNYAIFKIIKRAGHPYYFIAAKSKEHKNHSHHDGIKAVSYRSIPVPNLVDGIGIQQLKN